MMGGGKEMKMVMMMIVVEVMCCREVGRMEGWMMDVCVYVCVCVCGWWVWMEGCLGASFPSLVLPFPGLENANTFRSTTQCE